MDELVADFRLMFSNCRQFNEEGSMIYEDANLLERVMNEKLKEINSNHERKTPLKTFKSAKSKQLSPFEQKLRTLYDAIRDYRDPKGTYIYYIYFLISIIFFCNVMTVLGLKSNFCHFFWARFIKPQLNN